MTDVYCSTKFTEIQVHIQNRLISSYNRITERIDDLMKIEKIKENFLTELRFFQI
jgi:hypothetical protein